MRGGWEPKMISDASKSQKKGYILPERRTWTRTRSMLVVRVKNRNPNYAVTERQKWRCTMSVLDATHLMVRIWNYTPPERWKWTWNMNKSVWILGSGNRTTHFLRGENGDGQGQCCRLRSEKERRTAWEATTDLKEVSNGGKTQELELQMHRQRGEEDMVKVILEAVLRRQNYTLPKRKKWIPTRWVLKERSGTGSTHFLRDDNGVTNQVRGERWARSRSVLD